MKINRQLVWAKYNGHCAYCGKQISIKDMQIDHKFPRVGGLCSDINEYENLMPSCRRCNHYKRAHLLNDFRALLKTIHERIHNIYIVKVAEDYGIIEYHNWDGEFYFEKKIHQDSCEGKLDFDPAHTCCVCHNNWVDSDNGFDTCSDCLSKI